jgi:hypothetical protein
MGTRMEMNGSMNTLLLRQRYDYRTVPLCIWPIALRQTYYVTLDLSTPTDPPPLHPEPANKLTDPTYWFNPTLGRFRRVPQDAPTVFNANEDGEPETPAPQVESEDDDNAEENRQPPRKKKKDTTQSDGESANPNAEVSIIDLHTNNPLVSYKNQIYSCKWAENIGTELLFTPHDDENPLPNLKTLPGDVDLIAASSARLISTKAELQRKDGASEQSHSRPEVDFSILHPVLAKKVGRRAAPVRKEQGAFLDSLIKIKRDKGEEDRVTVIAQKRQTPLEWKEELRKKRNRERSGLKKTIREGKSWELDVELARERLFEMEREDERLEKLVIPERPVYKKQKRAGRRPKEFIGGGGLRLGQKGAKGKGAEGMVGSSVVGDESMMGRSDEGFEFGYDGAYDGASPQIEVFYGDEDMRYNRGYDGLHDEDAEGEEDDDTPMYG